MNRVRVLSSIHKAAHLSFSRSSGPGGQNVNKVNTKVELRLHLEDLEGISTAELEQIQQVLHNRIDANGDLIVTASEERSQRANRERVLFRTETLILNAAKLPKIRKASMPTKASRERRLKKKQLQSNKKRLRNNPVHEE